MHPHASMLQEYQYAINHLAPTVPHEVRDRAQTLHDELLSNEGASENDIRKALAETGKAEYPHRHAFEDMTAELRSTLTSRVLERLAAELRTKVGQGLAPKETIDGLTREKRFEKEFTAEERQEIEAAILDEKKTMEGEMTAFIRAHQNDYDALVEKWRGHAANIEKAIEELRSLADRDPKWRDDILAVVAQYEEGWAVTEPDPALEKVRKEIENWRGKMGEEV